MKLFLLMLGCLIPLFSCERSIFTDENPPGSPDTGFNRKILDGYFVTSIAFDSKGNAWIGTFDKGLIKYNDRETVVYNSSNSNLPEDMIIWEVETDSKDNIWIGGEGLIKYDGNNFTLYNSANSPIPENFVYSIAVDSKDNVWFTSSRFREGGIVRYDGRDWDVYTPDNSPLPVNLVRSIAIDSKDNVWLALSEIVNQTYLTKISGSEWTKYTSNDLGFTPYYFASIGVNSKNQLCGAIDYSLSSSMSHPGPQVFIFDGSPARQLKFDNTSMIRSLTIDNEDNIWCSTFGGFAVYNGVEWMINDTTFNNEGVFVIEQANDEKIWIGTGKGVYISG